VSEESNQGPHTPVLDSNQDAEDEEEIDPSPASHPVQVLETSVGEYGTPGWLKTTAASMSDEDKLLVDFGMIDISGGRTIQSNPRLRTAIREQLARKVPIREILSAVAKLNVDGGIFLYAAPQGGWENIVNATENELIKPGTFG
jgi:hypothetical protein